MLFPDGEPGPVERSVLPGGLRVVSQYLPGVRSASVGLWIGVGSRDEHPGHAGAAHFLEHLLFKATPTRSALDIAESMDAVGGEFNAFTAREHTCFYAHVLDDDLPLALDLVSDVVLRGRCRGDDVEIERSVVLEEIAMRDDDPEDLLGDAFLHALYAGHPIGRPIIGSPESVEAMTRRQLHSFHIRRYRPERMVVAAAGNIRHAEVVGLVGKFFGDALADGQQPVQRREGHLELRRAPRVAFLDRDSEQAHVSLGVRAYGRHDPRRWALSVLNTAIGGGMSSRLFQEIREKRGLAYSVYSGVDTFADTGAFSVYAGCQPECLSDVITLVGEVLGDVAERGISEAECRRAQGNLRGQLVLGLEDSSSRMHRIGRSELSYGNHLSVTDTVDRIVRVTPSDVAAVANDLLRRPFGAAVVGPYGAVGELPPQLKKLCRNARVR
ncbi:insulinase family protein [Hoyosella sp. YIM 151337]|uniref:M16 family metallopeptidase n=1 Tax=Hoyosella sp. YIM 151337 TaxID=2992742 RepID=UPI002236500B|nr:pitrilysin family protein [Hoyosella sp. YIM 151337]MCW4353874.1 insulinase family protein [Hoyosella sp. YIM 151337]